MIQEQNKTIRNLKDELTRVRLSKAQNEKVEEHLKSVHGKDATFVNLDDAGLL